MLTDFEETYCGFLDYLAPRLDVYEHVLYAYILRHTVLDGSEEAVIGFKSARAQMSKGSGQTGSAMSESTCRKKLLSLESIGAIEIVGTEHKGTRVRLVRPGDIPGIQPAPPDLEKRVSLEDMDFFEVEEHRLLILEREGRRCFYTLKELDDRNFVIDHVVSRPEGNNGYRNVVACSREANNKKGSTDAADFLFRLHHHDGVLDFDQLRDRLEALNRLQAGQLKPRVRSHEQV